MAAKSQKMYIDGKWVGAAGGSNLRTSTRTRARSLRRCPGGLRRGRPNRNRCRQGRLSRMGRDSARSEAQIFLKAADVMEVVRTSWSGR